MWIHYKKKGHIYKEYKGNTLIHKEEGKMHETMLWLPLLPPLFIDEQTAGKGVVIFSLDSLPEENDNISSPRMKSLHQTERVKQKYQKIR